MKKYKTLFAASFLLIIYASFLSSCRDASDPEEKKREVAILKLGTHTLIDEIEASVFSSIKERYGDAVKLTIYNGNFDDAVLRQSVSQIVSSDCVVVVPITTPASQEVINAAPKDLPIVFSFVSSPNSLWGGPKKRPENVTGTSDQIDYEKNLRLIMQLMPKAKTVGYLVNESEAQAQLGLKKVQEIASRLDFKIVSAPVSEPSDVSVAARSLAERVDVFLVGGDNTVVSGIGALLSVAERHSRPVFAVEKTSVEKGCVAAYGVDYASLGVETADLITRVLEGEKLSDIPVVYFSETKLYVNRDAMARHGLSVPDNVYKAY